MTDEPDKLASLMRKALEGDKQAYSALLQEILLSIHKARHTYDGLRPYKPWVFEIAQFRLLDYLRTHYADHLRHAAYIRSP